MQSIEALPLFPLSDVVLLPEVSVPLYIFEPRYRQMTRDALEGDHQIGMIAVRPEAVGHMGDDPPLFEVGCLGRIAHSQERPDGTYQMMLIGEQRFRVLAEHERGPGRLYRSARVELLEDAVPTSKEEKVHFDSSRTIVLDLLDRIVTQSQPEESTESMLAGFAALPPTRMINALSQSISFLPVERQQLLEAPSILDRFEIMEDLLRFRLAEARLSSASSSSLPN
jgi:Lon protease-like protein